MRILVTFPGRFGDLLWALPTMRAISEAAGRPVDLAVAGEFRRILPLLDWQPYLSDLHADDTWSLTPPAEWQPPAVTAIRYRQYDQVVHLGYRKWPDQPLAQFVYEQTRREYPDLPIAPLDLETPWILPPDVVGMPRVPWICAFGDAYFEMKYGLWQLLARRDRGRWPIGEGPLNLSTDKRWEQEAGTAGASWDRTAWCMTHASVVLACCSAPHVLAAALGRPVVCYEPMEARHNPIFYPLGQDGRVRLVRGLDGRPTFDARHTYDALQAVLNGR